MLRLEPLSVQQLSRKDIGNTADRGAFGPADNVVKKCSFGAAKGWR
jgi:hypothetical protein